MSRNEENEKFIVPEAQMKLRWDVPAEEIEKMDEAQLRQFLIETNEKVRRLYEAAMLEIRHHDAGDTRALTIHDIDQILNPEKL